MKYLEINPPEIMCFACTSGMEWEDVVYDHIKKRGFNTLHRIAYLYECSSCGMQVKVRQCDGVIILVREPQYRDVCMSLI